MPSGVCKNVQKKHWYRMKRQNQWYLSKYRSAFDNEMNKKKVKINKTDLKTELKTDIKTDMKIDQTSECESYLECYRKHLNTDKIHKMCSKFSSSNK